MGNFKILDNILAGLKVPPQVERLNIVDEQQEDKQEE
jgi:hypothetical protein